MTRVSDSMLHTRAQGELAKALTRVAHTQKVASNGLRVEVASDDPVAAAQSARTTADASRIESFLANARKAADTLIVADSTIESMSESLVRARELAIQGANETLSSADRAGIAREVRAIRDGLLAQGNTRHDGHYLFAGFANAAPPFDSAGAYVGDTNVLTLDVSRGLRAPVGITGDTLFAPASGVDVLAALDALESALLANDPAATRGTLGNLEQASGQLEQGRTELGTQLRSLDLAQIVGERLREQLASENSNLVEADAFASLSDVVRAESVLQRATELASRIPGGGLVRLG